MRKLLPLLLLLPALAFGQKISTLPAATSPLTGAELVPCDQSAVTSKCTVDQINKAPIVLCSGDTTGVTDTPVLQAAINAMPTYGGNVQLGPSCHYYINATLTIPLKYQYFLGGVAPGTIIEQVTNNTPVITFTGNGSWGWTIQNLTLQWTSNQASTNTNAIALYFNSGVSNGGSFNFWLNGIKCGNGFECISTAHSGNTDSLWGFDIANSSQGGSMTGAFFWAANAPTGEPRMTFRNIYLGAFPTTAGSVSEPEFFMNNGVNVLLENIEFNGGYYTSVIPQINISTTDGLTFNNVRSELETIVTSAGNGTGLWVLPNDNVVVIDAQLQSATINGTSQAAALIQGSGAATYNNLSIIGVSCQAVQGTGSGASVYPYQNGNLAATFVSGVEITSGGGNLCTQNLTNLGNIPMPKFEPDTLNAGGVRFTVSSGTGACATTTTLHGGQAGGDFLCTGTAGASTAVIAFGATTGNTSTHCYANDDTSGVAWAAKSASTSGVTLAGTIATTSDKVTFGCFGH